MKRWLAMVATVFTAVFTLEVAMVSSLLGCSRQPLDSAPTSTGTVGSTQLTTDNVTPTQGTDTTYPGKYKNLAEYFEIDAVPDRDPRLSIQYLPETVENPKDLPVLKWVYADYSVGRTWNEAAVHELNQMLADKNMPFRMQFVIVSMDTYWLMDADWLDLPEVQEVLAGADLITSAMGPDERLEYLIPITEYAAGDAQPSLKNAVAHELNWLSCLAEGEIYGIPTGAPTPDSLGWKVKEDFLKEMGLTVEDFDRNLWEMDTLFAWIYEQNGKKPFLYVETNDNGAHYSKMSGNINSVWPHVLSGNETTNYQYIGACYGIDMKDGKPTVINTMEQEEFRESRLAIRRYQEAGYIVQSTREQHGRKLAQIQNSHVNGDEVYLGRDGYVYIPVSTTRFDSSCTGSSSIGVAAVSKHQQEALQLLNLLAEDEAFREHLLFGKEGRDYTMTDGVYAMKQQEDGSCYEMRDMIGLSIFSSVNGNHYSYYPSGKSTKEAFQEFADSAEVVNYPIMFDYTGFEEELAEMGDLLGQLYYRYTQWTEEEYDGYLQKLKDAGSERIQAELQRQLDEWLAANPDWQ